MTIRIAVSDSHWTLNSAVTVYWAASLLIRGGRSVNVDLPSRPIIIPGLCDDASTAIKRVQQAYSPFPTDTSQINAIVAPEPIEGTLAAWSDGWTVWLDSHGESWGDENPLAAAFAGAILAARAEASCQGMVPLPYTFNLLDFTEDPQRGSPSTRIAPATLAGCGAVGSAYALAIAHTAPLTEIHLLDDEALDESNCIRYISAFPDQQDEAKAERLEQMLKDAGVNATGRRADAVTEMGDAPKLLISAVHEGDTRRRLAFNLPRRTIDGAVGPGLLDAWSATAEVSIAGFRPSPCIACFYHEESSSDALAGLAKDLRLNINQLHGLAEGKVTRLLLDYCQKRGITGLDHMEGQNIDSFAAAYCGAEFTAPDVAGRDVRPRRIFGPAAVGVLLAAVHSTGAYEDAGWTFRFDLAFPPSAIHRRKEMARPTCVVCAEPMVQARLEQLWDC